MIKLMRIKKRRLYDLCESLDNRRNKLNFFEEIVDAEELYNITNAGKYNISNVGK